MITQLERLPSGLMEVGPPIALLTLFMHGNVYGDWEFFGTLASVLPKNRACSLWAQRLGTPWSGGVGASVFYQTTELSLLNPVTVDLFCNLSLPVLRCLIFDLLLLTALLV